MSENARSWMEARPREKRLLSIRGRTAFLRDWDNVICIHSQTDPQDLQRCIRTISEL